MNLQNLISTLELAAKDGVEITLDSDDLSSLASFLDSVRMALMDIRNNACPVGDSHRLNNIYDKAEDALESDYYIPDMDFVSRIETKRDEIHAAKLEKIELMLVEINEFYDGFKDFSIKFLEKSINTYGWCPHTINFSKMTDTQKKTIDIFTKEGLFDSYELTKNNNYHLTDYGRIVLNFLKHKW